MDQFLLKGIKTCFITRGVPGSGKTTFAFNLKKQLELGGFTVEIAAADDYFPDGFKAENLGFAHTSCTKKLVSAMQNGIDAVIQHNTNVKEWESQALRSIAQSLGYMVYYVEMKYAFTDKFLIPKEFRWKSTHNVPDADIDRMRKGRQDIPIKYFGYWLTKNALLGEIEKVGALDDFNLMIGSNVISKSLHLTTDYIGLTKMNTVVSQSTKDFMKSAPLLVKGIFKNDCGIGALLQDRPPRYNLNELEANQINLKVPHLTLCDFGADAVKIGYEAKRFKHMLTLQPTSTKPSQLIQLKDFTALVFEPPLSIEGIYSAFFSTLGDFGHLSWTFEDKNDTTIFFRLIGMKTSLVKKGIDKLVSPDGRHGWILADLSTISGGPMEDKIFDESAFLRTHMRRGLSYLVSPEGKAIRVLAGLCKFTGTEDTDENPTQLPKTARTRNDDLSLNSLKINATETKYFLRPVEECRDLTILVTEKANGEAGHVRILKNDVGEVMVLAGSKNVHMLFRYQHPEDLALYPEERYQYAREISQTFLDQYPYSKSSEFIRLMLDNECTACFEYEDPSHQHIISLAKRQLKFITFATMNSVTSSFCQMSPLKALEKMKSLGHLCVRFKLVHYNEMEKVKNDILFDKLPAEGAVLYFIDGNDVICIQKYKNATYILSRLIREKVVPLYQLLVKSLSTFGSEGLGVKINQVNKIKDLDLRMKKFLDAIEVIDSDYKKRIDGFKRGQIKKLCERLDSIVETKFVPLNAKSLQSWKESGVYMIESVTGAFYSEVSECLCQWKQACIESNSMEIHLLLESLNLIAKNYDSILVRNEWPNRWSTNSEIMPILTEKDI